MRANGQQHLETAGGPDGVGDVGGHQEQLAGLGLDRLPADTEGRRPVQDLTMSGERRSNFPATGVPG